jgi:hypothetical protein
MHTHTYIHAFTLFACVYKVILVCAHVCLYIGIYVECSYTLISVYEDNVN